MKPATWKTWIGFLLAGWLAWSCAPAHAQCTGNCGGSCPFGSCGPTGCGGNCGTGSGFDAGFGSSCGSGGCAAQSYGMPSYAFAAPAVSTAAQITEDSPKLLDFTAKWCQPCQAMQLAMDELKQAGVNVWQVDVDENPRTQERFKVKNLPTFIICDRNWQEISRIEGKRPVEDLRRAITAARRSAPSGAVARFSAPAQRPGRSAALPRRAGDSGWYDWPASHDVSGMGLCPALADIESHLSPGSVYVNHGSPGNWAHEGTHGINADIRNALGGGASNGRNAFYVFGGKAMYLREPRIRKSDVARFVPANLRGGGFDLYVAAQSEWDSQPLYLVDELSAYANGTAAYRQAEPSGFQHSLSEGLEFVGYGGALLDAIDALDPDYPDRKLLADFLNFETKQLLGSAHRAGIRPDLTALRAAYGSKIYALNPVAPAPKVLPAAAPVYAGAN